MHLLRFHEPFRFVLELQNHGQNRVRDHVREGLAVPFDERVLHPAVAFWALHDRERAPVHGQTLRLGIDRGGGFLAHLLLHDLLLRGLFFLRDRLLLRRGFLLRGCLFLSFRRLLLFLACLALGFLLHLLLRLVLPIRALLAFVLPSLFDLRRRERRHRVDPLEQSLEREANVRQRHRRRDHLSLFQRRRSKLRVVREVLRREEHQAEIFLHEKPADAIAHLRRVLRELAHDFHDLAPAVFDLHGLAVFLGSTRTSSSRPRRLCPRARA
mmetsp:Transcript_3327/g.11163  ORF Transcript_3327/g.11163 Transcript_3327/m.11163 type:complete len:269 (+) Transcript_3327:359-1165(+)